MELRKEYLKWLKGNPASRITSENSLYSYCYGLTKNYNGKVVVSNNKITYGDVYEYFLSCGQYDWLERIICEFEEINASELEKKNQKTYWKKLKEFLTGEARFLNFTSNIDITPGLSPDKKPRLYARYPLIDGMFAFWTEFEIEKILDLCLKTIFFFEQKSASKRFKELVNKIDKGEKGLYARGDKRGCPQYPQYPINYIQKDKDGNSAVRELIKAIFGYNLTGDNKNFRSYTISHLWGKANNPLFFTNLCNLALIPDWINHLMDRYSLVNSTKDDEMERYSLVNSTKDDEVSANEKKALTIVNTIRKIALKYYEIPSLLHGTNLSENVDFPINKNYVKKGTYSINVIMPLDPQGLFDSNHGRITRQIVTI